MRVQGNRERQAESLAMGLGWFSVALGLAELAAPRELSRLIGIREDDRTISTLRACGARELANGLAILAEPDRAAWLWSRVGGDAIDLALIGAAYRRDDTDTARLGTATAAVAGVTALDALCATWLAGAGDRDLRRLALSGGRDERSVRIEHVTTINKPIEEVYAFWRNFQNLPRFMRHLESVETTGSMKDSLPTLSTSSSLPGRRTWMRMPSFISGAIEAGIRNSISNWDVSSSRTIVWPVLR